MTIPQISEKTAFRSLAKKEQILFLRHLIGRLQEKPLLREKLLLLDQESEVVRFLKGHPKLAQAFSGYGQSENYCLKSLIALGQGQRVFHGYEEGKALKDNLSGLISVLGQVESFYQSIGGILGYHLTVLERLEVKQQHHVLEPPSVHYHKPHGMNIAEDSSELRQIIRYGIEHLGEMAEIYPVGGAGERLRLRDDENGESLPVAYLQFGGISLLEWLMRDLEAKEYLHYKLTGVQLVTPVALMTSHEAHNHEKIGALCEEREWFRRPKHCFFLFAQPSAPVLDDEGNWQLEASLKLNLKPGGHGVIWKAAQDHGVFRWLREAGRTNLCVRQINNPIAGCDHGILAFTGRGLKLQKSFGFLSCPRIVKAAEGMNALVETKQDKNYTYTISNIEYTELEQKGQEDVPESPGSLYSHFPANTNILFASLDEIETSLQRSPLPGLLLNMKGTVIASDEKGHERRLRCGRLESTMQNIADVIVDRFSVPMSPQKFNELKTYLCFNERRKTISVTKKQYVSGKKILETPEGCFYDMCLNHYVLLKERCGFSLPEVPDERVYLDHGPSFLLSYHPALGPLYGIIAQKVQGGILHPGSEMQLEISELLIRDLDLKGSLSIVADQLTGGGAGQYSERTGKCSLINVHVENKGIDWGAENNWWENRIHRHETLAIVLQGDGEFHAEDITLRGSIQIEVPAGFRVVAYEEEGEVKFRKEPLSQPSWYWKYIFDNQDQIVLQKHVL